MGTERCCRLSSPGYENGTLIVATGDIVTFAVAAKVVERNSLPVDPPEPTSLTEIEMTDNLVIDGRTGAVTNTVRIPAAGTVVAWKMFVAT